MKKRSLCRFVPAIALALVAGTAVPAYSAVAADEARVVSLQRDEGTSLVLAGSVFHTTANDVRNLRDINGPAGELIILWDEATLGGAIVPHYAVSLDGRTIAGRVRETSYTLDLRFARFDPLVQGEPQMHPFLRAQAGNDQFIVQFWVPPTDSMRRQIEALGGSVERYFAGGTHVIRMSGQTRAAVENLPYVRWVGEHHPAYRADDAAQAFVTQGIASNEPHRWHINVYRQGHEQQGAVEALIKNMGGVVHYTQPDLFRMEATLTPDQLLQVLNTNVVEYVDVWLGFGGHDMDIGRQLMGTNFVQSGGLNFSGQGVNGEIFDTENCMTHVEWRNTPLLHSTSAAGSTHGSSCFGICFAQGTSPQHKGHMPDGRGIFFLYTESTQFNGPKTRLQIAQESTSAPYFSVFQTSSVGSPQVPNYTALSAEMDTVLLQTNYLHCQSQSNTGNQNSRPQAWAKNMVSGGAVQHNNNPNRSAHGVSGASIGPSPEGRIKPDLAGFYDNIATTSSCGYTSGFGGTSGGTPMVCGTIGIFFQMWHEGVFPGRGGLSTVFESRAKITTAKAAMIATAYRYPFAQLNRFRQGWGMPDLRKLYETRNKSVIIDGDDPVTHLEVKTYNINVDVGEPELNVVMCYIEPAGALSPAPARVNDLSLRVTSPSGTTYWGNNGLTAGNFSTPGGNSNVVDTVEAVFIQNPEPGPWTVEIFGDEVIFDTDPTTPGTQASFSMWASGATGGPAPLSVRFATPAPTQIDPGVETELDVLLIEGSDTLVAGTAKIFFRYDGQNWDSADLVQINGEEWQATLPSANCNQTPDFYLIAEGVNTGVRTNPAGAPTNFYSAIVGEAEAGNLIDASFESGLPAGWELSGLWNVATTCSSGASCAGTRWLYYGITGQCNYNSGGHNFGSALSPVIDLPTLPFEGSITLSYCMSKVTEGSNFFDKAEVLFNGQVIDAPADSQAWTNRVIDLSAYAGQSGRLEFRFDTRDGNRNNQRGWLVDGVKVSFERRVCEGACYADCDTSTGVGVLDIFDFLCFGNAFDQGDPYACNCDESTGPNTCDIFDFLCFGNAFDAGCP